MTNTTHGELKNPGYEIFMLLVSLLSIVNLAFLILPFGDSRSKEVVVVIDAILIPVFVADFIYRLATASSRSWYFLRGWGWADLLGCLPLLRVFRLFRVARAVRLMQAMGPQGIAAELIENRAANTLLITVFLVIVVLEIGGSIVLPAETSAAGSNIETPGDALWWGYVTITTVGYGDKYPVTFAGRLTGVFLLTAGVALFSVFTGFIANTFLRPRPRRRLAALRRPDADDPRARISEIRRLLEEQDERTATLREKLDEMERLLAAGVEPTAERQAT